MIGPLRPSSSDSSTPRRATRPLSPESWPPGCRSGQLQADFALFLPGMLGVGKGLPTAESSHRPRASILHSAASSRPAALHNFLPVALTAATVPLLSIHHRAGAKGILFPRAHLPLLLLQLLFLLRGPEAVAAGAGAAAAAKEARPAPLPQRGLPHAGSPRLSSAPRPAPPSTPMTLPALPNKEARRQSRARKQPMETGNKGNRRDLVRFADPERALGNSGWAGRGRRGGGSGAEDDGRRASGQPRRVYDVRGEWV